MISGQNAPVLRIAVVGALVALLTGCGATPAVGPAAKVSHAGPASLAGSGPKTTASTARFTIVVTGVVAGTDVFAEETGTVSFIQPRAHIYRLALGGGGIPQEIVVNGPITYTNANVQAAMNDPTVKAWTKLDTRRLTAKQRQSESDELTYVRDAAYLAYGVSDVKRLGTDAADNTTHFRGTVDPARLAARLPATQRSAILAAVRRDYVARPFQADFWVDDQGRVRRIYVTYRTAGGGHLTVKAAYSQFGTHVNLAVPPARDVTDITP
jgi:hypothetical protein